MALVITKNAFDWVISMWKLPYHAPMHSFDFANRSAFMRRPWALLDTFEQVRVCISDTFDGHNFLCFFSFVQFGLRRRSQTSLAGRFREARAPTSPLT